MPIPSIAELTGPVTTTPAQGQPSHITTGSAANLQGQQGQEKIQLIDIHLPANPSAWPPAPGWWIIFALILSLLIFSLLKLIRYRRLKIRQKNILLALTGLEEKLKREQTTEALSEVNILLRRLALMHYPRQTIASLTGKNWLRFLDKSGDTKAFTQGAGRLLADVPYSLQMPDSVDLNGLTNAVTQWVKLISMKPAEVNNGGKI